MGRLGATFLVSLLLGTAASEAAAETPAEMEPLTWLAVPDSKMRSVQADPELYSELQGNGFENIMLAWSGAVLDTQRLRLVIWGGGHNDYYGNELYAFDIETLQWERLTEPTVNWNNCGDPNADGTANARHTYSGMAYIEHADRFFVTGGALNCFSGSCGAEITWEFDFDTLTWTDRQASGEHTTQCENSAAYDPETKTVYYGDSGGLYGYNYDTNAWTRLNEEYLYAKGVTIDTSRGTLLMISDGEVCAYDIAGGNFDCEVWNTTGGDAFIAGTDQGLAYDPTTDRIVGWGGDTIYALDPQTRAWETYEVPGGPVVDDPRVWGRWRYVPDVNAFILVTGVDTDVHFFKFSDGGMIPPGGGGSSGSDTGSNDDGNDGEGPGSADSAADDGSNTGGSGPSSVTATGGSADSNAADPDDGGDSGCGCRGAGGPSVAGWLGLLLAAGAARRKRRCVGA